MSALAGSRLSPAEALGLCQSRLGTGSAGHTGAGKRGKVGKGGLAGRVGGPRLFSVTLQLGGLFGSKGGGICDPAGVGNCKQEKFWGPLQSQGAKGLGKNTRAEEKLGNVLEKVLVLKGSPLNMRSALSSFQPPNWFWGIVGP